MKREDLGCGHRWPYPMPGDVMPDWTKRDLAESIARKMALADRPDYPDNGQFWEGYLPVARQWLAAREAFKGATTQNT